MITTVIHHSADFDGIFCREIARKFLPDAELLGWDFSDPPLMTAHPGFNQKIYVLDLPIDKPFGLNPERFPEWVFESVTWIDHHASSIASHPKSIPGYRIDGVAACRLAWQWFQQGHDSSNRSGVCAHLPAKGDFVSREVHEPYAVRLAGEYDIWDKRDPNAELFQHGLRSEPLTDGDWKLLLGDNSEGRANVLLENGKAIQFFQTAQNESVIKAIGFDLDWEGLHFLACNHARYNSHLFTAGLKPEHDACFGFKYSKGGWEVSLYHAPGKEHHDLSKIAVKHGGGGHKGACGFRTKTLPFLQ